MSNIFLPTGEGDAQAMIKIGSTRFNSVITRRRAGYIEKNMRDQPNTEKKIKAKAAMATDSAADKSASLTGGTHKGPPTGTTAKKGKLLSKNKHRLPRRDKKARQKGTDRL